jgi:uncharacterized protein (TIGR00645 family)
MTAVFSNMNTYQKRKLGNVIFAARWILYPINLGLLLVLATYVAAFLVSDWEFVRHGFRFDPEYLGVMMLGFVDAAMVANLVLMIAQGGHQIFIHKFDIPEEDRAQYLDHIDSGLLKVKVAQSIAGITLVQVLKDFVNIKNTEWNIIVHRMIVHVVCLVSAIIMACIWRITHPTHPTV